MSGKLSGERRSRDTVAKDDKAKRPANYYYYYYKRLTLDNFRRPQESSTP